MIFDTHIHLNDDKLYENLSINIKEAKELGINKFLCIGWDYESSLLATQIANEYKEVYAAIGYIPTEYKKWNENSISLLEDLLKKSNKIIAIGEIGLDYYWEKEEDVKKIQKEMFIKQIELANKYNLPVSIHCRDALQDGYDILKEHKVNNAGVMHCYSGSIEMAKLFIKLGYKIAFGGVLTFKNSIVTKQVLTSIDLDNVVLETDAPYLAPMPNRGKVNLPKYIKDISLYASDLLKMDNKIFEDKVYKNSLEIFHVETDENED